VSSRWSDREVIVGQPLVCQLPVRAGDVAAVLQTPDGDSQAPTASADGRNVTSEPTTRAGFHKFVLGPPVGRTEWFAVNVDPEESDLASLRADDLRTDILPGIEFTYQTDWEEPSVATAEKTVRVVSTSSGLSRSLLIAVFCLLVVEQLMAWRFTPGILLLLAFVIVALAAWAWSASALSGVLMLLFGAATFGLLWFRRQGA
jgi:hypothetical protein